MINIFFSHELCIYQHFNTKFPTNQILSQGNPRDEVLANRLLEFLMKHSFHSKRAVFRHNLEIIRTLVECWKDCLHVPYR